MCHSTIPLLISNQWYVDRLLDYVKVPYVNIHPVPINVLEYEDACQAYEKEVQTYIVGASIDFVVLGVGRDGHTASPFPS